MKPLVYVAGPITIPEPMENTHIAAKEASILRDTGLLVPFVPHLTCVWHLIDPAEYETWMRYDFDVIAHCHALYRLDGPSAGADREVEYAGAVDVPVFTDRQLLLRWAKQWTRKRSAA